MTDMMTPETMPETTSTPKTTSVTPPSDNEAYDIIQDAITLKMGERLVVRRITDRCFRANVWSKTRDGLMEGNIISRSYFVTIRPDEILIS